MHLHFDCSHVFSAYTKQVRAAMENRDLGADLESRVLEPGFKRFDEFGFEAKGHVPGKGFSRKASSGLREIRQGHPVLVSQGMTSGTR